MCRVVDTVLIDQETVYTPRQSNEFSEVIAEDRIAVAQQVARELGKGKGLPQLLSCPLRGRVGGNIEVQDATSVMGQNQENVKNLETDRRHGEEIDGDQLPGMILKECPPALRGRFVTSQHDKLLAPQADLTRLLPSRRELLLPSFQRFGHPPRCRV